MGDDIDSAPSEAMKILSLTQLSLQSVTSWETAVSHSSTLFNINI